MIDDAEEELCCLRISRPQCQRGRQVEDAAGAVDRQPHGIRVQEVQLEQPEPRVRARQALQVLRLALIICKGEKTKIRREQETISLHFIWRAERRESMLPRFLTVAWTA